MSTDIRIRALELAVAAAAHSGGADVVTVADKFLAFLTVGTAGTNALAGAGKAANKPAKPAVAAAQASVETPIETAESQAKEPAKEAAKAITQDEIKIAVIALVNAGNKAASNETTGREYAAGILQPFGAKNVSTVKPEDYAKVLEALKAKTVAVLKAAEAEADLAG